MRAPRVNYRDWTLFRERPYFTRGPQKAKLEQRLIVREPAQGNGRAEGPRPHEISVSF